MVGKMMPESKVIGHRHIHAEHTLAPKALDTMFLVGKEFHLVALDGKPHPQEVVGGAFNVLQLESMLVLSDNRTA
jgi:hypothetical protein